VRSAESTSRSNRGLDEIMILKRLGKNQLQ
jgi:hypothetical protein